VTRVETSFDIGWNKISFDHCDECEYSTPLLNRIVKDMTLDLDDLASIDAVKFIASNIEMPLVLPMAV
jgi:hypothetical protein